MTSVREICAPGTYDADANTCFTMDMIKHIAKSYNKYISNKSSPSLSTKPNYIDITDDKKYVLKQILDRFKSVCGDDQVCITQQEFMNTIIMNNSNNKEEKIKLGDYVESSLLPVLPDNPTQWLNTTDINNLMKQYENYYSDFHFTGAVARNCIDLSF